MSLTKVEVTAGTPFRAMLALSARACFSPHSAPTAEVFWTCTSHALSTEAEEVMGLLLGDVLVNLVSSAMDEAVLDTAAMLT